MKTHTRKKCWKVFTSSGGGVLPEPQAARNTVMAHIHSRLRLRRLRQPRRLRRLGFGVGFGGRLWRSALAVGFVAVGCGAGCGVGCGASTTCAQHACMKSARGKRHCDARHMASACGIAVGTRGRGFELRARTSCREDAEQVVDAVKVPGGAGPLLAQRDRTRCLKEAAAAA